MTSIIGYTRVPFNSSASKHFSIAPVKQLYQNKPTQQVATLDQQNSCILKNGQNHNSKNNDTIRRPSYHRMFSREMSQHGIIELIIDKNQQQQEQQQPIDDNPNRTNINSKKETNPLLPLTTCQHIKPTNYKIFLSIDLRDNHEYDSLSVMKDDTTGYDNLKRLMDYISRIAQEKTIHFVNILNLLKKLLLQQENHRFMSCIDKHSEKILIYFPKTISLSSSSVDQTYEWLKYTVGIDVNKFKYWKLSLIEEEEPHFEEENSVTITTKNNDTNTKKDIFDGESYFNDIHLFIDHVDSLIESNGLFSKTKNQ